MSQIVPQYLEAYWRYVDRYCGAIWGKRAAQRDETYFALEPLIKDPESMAFRIFLFWGGTNAFMFGIIKKHIVFDRAELF